MILMDGGNGLVVGPLWLINRNKEVTVIIINIIVIIIIINWHFKLHNKFMSCEEELFLKNLFYKCGYMIRLERVLCVGERGRARGRDREGEEERERRRRSAV